MSGINAMFFGGSVFAFMGAWDVQSFFTNDYGQTLALGYDTTNQPYVVTSTTTDTFGFSTRGSLMRIGWQRDTVWDRYASSVYCFASALDSGGNTLGLFRSPSGTLVTTLAKFDTTGTLVWQRKLSDAASVGGMFIGVDSGDNTYVSGTCVNNLTIFIAKYNSSGNIQWQRTLAGSSSLTPMCMSVSTGGDVVIGGSYGADVFIAKYNSSGTIQWQKYTSWADNTFFNAVVQDSSGNIYGFISAYSDGGATTAQHVIKLNSSGVRQWGYSASNAWYSDTGGGAAIDADGFIYFAVKGGPSPQATYIVKVNSSGALQFARSVAATVDLYDTPRACDIVVDNQEFMWVTGTAAYASSTYYMFLMRAPSSGTLTGTYSIPTPNAISITYASTSFSLSSYTLNSSNTSFTDAAGTLTDAAGALSFSAVSETAYTVDM